MGILMNLCLVFFFFFYLFGLLWFVFSMNLMWKLVSLLEWQIFIFILSYFPSPSHRSWRSQGRSFPLQRTLKATNCCHPISELFKGMVWISTRCKRQEILFVYKGDAGYIAVSSGICYDQSGVAASVLTPPCPSPQTLAMIP